MSKAEIQALPDEDLRRHATEVRQQIEAISPYRSRHLLELRDLIKLEWLRRDADIKAGRRPAYAWTPGL